MLDFIKEKASQAYDLGSSFLSSAEGKIAAGFFAVKTAYNLYNNDAEATTAAALTTVATNAGLSTGVYFGSKLAKDAYNKRQAPAPAPVNNGGDDDVQPRRNPKRRATKKYR